MCIVRILTTVESLLEDSCIQFLNFWSSPSFDDFFSLLFEKVFYSNEPSNTDFTVCIDKFLMIYYMWLKFWNMYVMTRLQSYAIFDKVRSDIEFQY